MRLSAIGRLKNPVPRENVGELGALAQLVAGPVFACRPSPWPGSAPSPRSARDDHDAVGVAHDHGRRGRPCTPAHITGTSIAATWPRPFESSGPMPPWKTGKRICGSAGCRATRPSVTQPAALRARQAVVSSSPQGAMRPMSPQARTVISSGLEIVDQLDLELVGVLAGRHVIDLAVEAGAGPAQHHQRLIQRADLGVHRLVAQAQPVEHIGQDARRTGACAPGPAGRGGAWRPSIRRAAAGEVEHGAGAEASSPPRHSQATRAATSSILPKRPIGIFESM